jgi:hypothetical protein
VTFLITWFASLVNLLREENFSPRRARVPGIAFALILGVTLVAGNLRLAGQPERSVPIGSVTVSYDAYIDMWDFSVYIESGTDPARVPEMKKISSLTADALFRESESLARAGAKIILWSEINVFLFPDQEKAFTKRARDFARKEGVYLIAAAARLTPGTDMYENWAAAFTPRRGGRLHLPEVPSCFRRVRRRTCGTGQRPHPPSGHALRPYRSGHLL